MSDAVHKKFMERVNLRIAQIIKVERHPAADKLYIETISLGNEERIIVSGLVPYYSAEELLNKYIILVYNLKPAKLRGVESKGMLLAAEADETVEVISVDGATPGERIVLEDCPDPGTAPAAAETSAASSTGEITIDEFFEIPIEVKEHYLFIEGKRLVCGSGLIKTVKVKDGKVC